MRRCALWVGSVSALILPALGCAPRGLTLPSGDGVPFPDAVAVYHRAVAGCSAVHTITAELGLSGRVGRRSLRARLLAGLAPAALRLEAVAPFGPPVFILVADRDRSTLLLPREERVLSGATPAAILEALTGVERSPDELRGILTGCPGTGLRPLAGRTYGSDWAAIDLADHGTLTIYLRRIAGDWRLVAAVDSHLRIEYADHDPSAHTPARIRLLALGSEPGRAKADLRVNVSQIELNRPLDPAAFTVKVPAGAVPLTLDELRASGPMGHSGT